MLGLLLFAGVAAGSPSTDVDACRMSLANRIGQLGTFAPSPKLRRNRLTVINGVVDAFEKPLDAPSGMMTPTHILVTRYTFRCEIGSGVVRHLTLHRQPA